MGRVRRYGYTVEWFIGDHEPRHVHVYDSKGRFLGRLALDSLTGLKGLKPSRNLLKFVRELQKEGRL